tara:strand:- start:450 stop:1052 length:603 start_codon:yes stop_codon:yes gene_type:complete
MNRISFDAEDPAPNFIGGWFLQRPEVCDELIAFFNSERADRKAGEIADGLRPDLKKCIDCSIDPKHLNLPEYACFKDYMAQLIGCYEDYKAKWPFLSQFLKEVHVGRFNIQRYLAGDHYKAIHTERMSLTYSHRIFAWMTYLNDVEDGGETVFVHYGLKVKPKKGLTLIWPVEWTHAHYGSVLGSGEKYIINGHIDFPPT